MTSVPTCSKGSSGGSRALRAIARVALLGRSMLRDSSTACHSISVRLREAPISPVTCRRQRPGGQESDCMTYTSGCSCGKCQSAQWLQNFDCVLTAESVVPLEAASDSGAQRCAFEVQFCALPGSRFMLHVEAGLTAV